MKSNNKYSNEELSSGIKYIMNVVEWVKISYGEEAANEWVKGGFSDSKYMVEYNAAYVAFFEKVVNLRRDQKEAMEEMLLTKVYCKIRERLAYERLEKRLCELEKY